MKTIFRNLLIVAAAGTALNVAAQSVTYNYIRNNPFDTKNLTFAIDPFFTEINGHNGGDGKPGYAFGWGVRAEHMMGKSLLMNVDMRTAFGTTKFRKSNENTRNYFNMEGGVGLILSQRVRTRNVPIILSQTTSGNTRTTTYIRGGVPARCRSIIAFRAGLQQYMNTFDYNSKMIADSLLTFASDGNTVTYREAANTPSLSVFTHTVDNVQMTIDQLGGIAITSLYAGFQFRTIRDLVIDVAGYGYRGNIRYSDFYIDLMFAPVIALRDFRTPDARYNVKYEQMSSLGWRLGWFFRKPKEQGFSTKFEIGSRPGFKTPTNVNVPLNMKNMYCMLTFGLYIPLKIKPIYMGDESE